MKKFVAIGIIVASIFLLVSFTTTSKSLREIYSQPPSKWPAYEVARGNHPPELGVLPAIPDEQKIDSLKDIINLGKALFFDTRLSGSGKISCATCHQPELNWTDGKIRSVGHEGALNKRNSPTLQNSWFYHRLFWDGRAKDLQDQAFAPLNSETEMHNEMQDIMSGLRRIAGYKPYFKKAFGDDFISPDRLTAALAAFERTITSRRSRFDEFLLGNKKALTNKELKGLHLFRTKAQCMNCHGGPLFSDNQFHNNGFGDGDPGYYSVSHLDADIGKFKTPSLRDVMRTGPWMQSGQADNMKTIIAHYNNSAFGKSGVDRLISKLHLNRTEQEQLIAFLGAISAEPLPLDKPVLPE